MNKSAARGEGKKQTDITPRRPKELARAIADHPFFDGISPEALAHFSEGAADVQFDAGQTIFRESEPANRFYLIEQGEVALESHVGKGDVLIQKIGGGDVLGWSWLFAPYFWHFTAKATTSTRAIALNGAHVLVFCEKNPALGYEVMKRIVKIVVYRLQASRKSLATRIGSV